MLLFTALLTLVACEPADTTPEAPAVHDTGALPEPCADVCWSWEPAPPPPVCNADGLEPDTCPPGFRCQRVDPDPADPDAPTRRCVGNGGPYTLTADLTPLWDAPRAVELRVAPPEGAGSLLPRLKATLRGVHRGHEETITVPSDAAPKLLYLRPDTYEVTLFTITGIPWTPLTGELRVTEDGAATIELPVRHPTIELTLDGQRWTEVPPDSTLSFSWSSATVGRYETLSSGDPIAHVGLLPLGIYELELTFRGSGWPARDTIKVPCTITADNARCEVEAQSYTFSGVVTLNGGPLPTPGVGSLSVGYDFYPLEPDGSFSLQLLSRAVDLWYHASFRSSEPRLPQGSTPLAFGVSAHPRLVYDLHTTQVQGRVGFLQEGGRDIDLHAEYLDLTLHHTNGATASLDLDPDGEFEGAVWTGEYDPEVSWSTGYVGCSATTARVSTVESYLNIDVNLFRTSISVTVDGASPAADTLTDVSWTFQDVSSDRRCHATQLATLLPLQAELWMPAGRWKVGVSGPSPLYPDAPAGLLRLPEIDTSTHAAHPIDLESRVVTLGLQKGSGPFIPILAKNRGQLIFDNASAGFDDHDAAHTTVRLWPGPTDVRWWCGAECDVEGNRDDVDLVLWSSLEL